MMTTYDSSVAMRQLQEEMNRVFGQSLARGGSDDQSNVATSQWTPLVDIKEEAERFVIAADVPGVDAKKIEVAMDKGVLTIRGERILEARSEGDDSHRRIERQHGTFYRRFSLPDTADADRITARGHNGVLEVIIPKKVAAQPRLISVTN